jgi:hypothetical protein
MPVIPATEEAEIRKLRFEASPGKQFTRPCLKKNITRKDWWSD